MKKAINFLKNLKDLNTNQIACDRSNNVTKIIPHLFPKQVRSSSVFSQRGPPRPRKNSIKINLLAKSPGAPLPPQEPRRSVKTIAKASTARISPKRWVAENQKKFLEVPRPSELKVSIFTTKFQIEWHKNRGSVLHSRLISVIWALKYLMWSYITVCLLLVFIRYFPESEIFK